MKPICSFCGKEIERAGGLAFSPPAGVDGNYPVTKLHICQECWRNKIRKLESTEHEV